MSYETGRHFGERDGVARLHINESPWRPPRGAVEAGLAALTDARRYPDPDAAGLRRRIADLHEVGVEHVVVGAGGDGLLDAVFRAYARGTVGLTRPTYGVLQDLAALYSVDVATVPWGPGMDLGVPHAALTCVVNPNSPTGEWLPPDVLACLLPRDGRVVVVDEAYAPYTGASVVPLLEDSMPWLVVRSFSKVYSLASMRIGYAVGHPDVVARVRAVQGPYPVSGVALAAAEAALEDEGYLAEVVERNRRVGARLGDFLAAHGWDPGTSQGNFLYVRPPGGEAERWRTALLEKGVAVRLFPQDDPERLRISLGADEELERLMDAVASRTVALR